MFKEDGGTLAEWLHNTYEKIAKEENWETQKDCQVAFKDLPEENQHTMLALAQAIQVKYFVFFLLNLDNVFGKHFGKLPEQEKEK